MFDLIRIHSAVIEYLDLMGRKEFDIFTGAEPLNAKARFNAIHLLARRVDLSLGMSVQIMHDGGVRLDILRNGLEYIIEIDSCGRSAIVSDRGFGVSRSCINEEFLSELHKEIPDPTKLPYGHFSSLPLPGVILSDSERGMEIQVSNMRFVGLPVSSKCLGFDTIFLTVDEEFTLGKGDGIDLLNQIIRSGSDVYLGRRFMETDFVCLHRINDCPDSVIGSRSLSNGIMLKSIRKAINPRKSQAA